MSETAIKAAIMAFLRKEGGWWWRQGAGPYQVSGCPDILGVYKGRMVGIEVKTPEAYKKKDGGCTKNQNHFMNKMNENGAFTLVACSVEEVKDFLALLGRLLSSPSQSE